MMVTSNDGSSRLWNRRRRENDTIPPTIPEGKLPEDDLSFSTLIAHHDNDAKILG